VNEPSLRTVEVQIRVVADRKEGLLLELGQLVMAKGFTLLRQRLGETTEGAALALTIRGPESGMLELEEHLANHPRVRSYESMAREVGLAPTNPIASPSSRVAAPAHGAPAPTAVRAHAATASAKGPFDRSRLEVLLPQLAADYPQILPRLVLLEREIPEDEQDSVMRYIGGRVGAWVYKRDFALGARLGLHDAVRHIALPAIRQLLPSEMDEENLRVKSSPFCGNGRRGRTCHFFRGFFEGLINTSRSDHPVTVEEAICRNSGSSHCTFAFHD
jgi:predicted hydrocarbon binding protein